MTKKQVNKETAAQLKQIRTADAVWQAHAAEVIQGLPLKTEAARAAASAFLEAVLGALLEGGQALEAKDLAVSIERQDDDPARKARDMATRHLYGLTTRARPTLEAALGAEVSTRYGLSGATPQQPDQLADFSGRVADLLASDAATFTDLFGQDVDTTKIAAILQPAVQALRQALRDTNREQSELDRALAERDAEAARLDRLTRAAFCLLESLFLLSDQEVIFRKALARARAQGGGADAAPEVTAPAVEP